MDQARTDDVAEPVLPTARAVPGPPRAVPVAPRAVPGPPRPVAPTNDTEALDTEALDTDALGAEALNEPLGMGSQNGAASSTSTGDDDPAADGAVRAAGGSGDLGGDLGGSLRRRAEAVEAMPLAERADAFSALHDDLRTRLEQGGAARA